MFSVRNEIKIGRIIIRPIYEEENHLDAFHPISWHFGLINIPVFIHLISFQEYSFIVWADIIFRATLQIGRRDS